jgi:hypothetical protein
MPASQVAAIILFWAQVASGIAAAIFVGQFTYRQWKRVGKVDMTLLLSNHPRWVIGLIAFSIATGIVGLWLTYHIPRPEKPSPCPTISEKPNPVPAPQNPAPTQQKAHTHTPKRREQGQKPIPPSPPATGKDTAATVEAIGKSCKHIQVFYGGGFTNNKIGMISNDPDVCFFFSGTVFDHNGNAIIFNVPPTVIQELKAAPKIQ